MTKPNPKLRWYLGSLALLAVCSLVSPCYGSEQDKADADFIRARQLGFWPTERHPNRDHSLLTRLTKRDMRRDHIRALDALVTFVPYEERPSPEILKEMDARGRSRWRPTEHGGNDLKMPYHGGPMPAGHYHVERGGWDYEDCDGCCGTHLSVGDRCWVTREGDFQVLCDDCYFKLK